MKLPRASTVVQVSLYSASLAAIGVGAWMIGGADWRGAGPLAVGLLVWLDLWTMGRQRAAKPPKRGSG